MGKIDVLGLGAGNLKQLPLGIYERLQQTAHVYVRTEQHPVIRDLKHRIPSLQFSSYDAVYESSSQFSYVYAFITKDLFQRAKEKGHIIYAVPGHPLVAEETVQRLLSEKDAEQVDVQIIGGHSFLDELFTALHIDPNDGCTVVDGTHLHAQQLQPRFHTLITQVYDRMVASDVKLTLMELYPDEYPVYILTALGMGEDQNVQSCPLYELDRRLDTDGLTTVYVPPTEDNQVLNRRFEQARSIFRTLRGPDGCPWDQQQTHHSLKKYLLEETYEVLEAIDEQDVDHLQEELGDVLLQVFLHAQIAEDDGLFNMEDVLASLNAKMIHRHPHVFGDVQVQDMNELGDLWKKMKEEARQRKQK